MEYTINPNHILNVANVVKHPDISIPKFCHVQINLSNFNLKLDIRFVCSKKIKISANIFNKLFDNRIEDKFSLEIINEYINYDPLVIREVNIEVIWLLNYPNNYTSEDSIKHWFYSKENYISESDIIPISIIEDDYINIISDSGYKYLNTHKIFVYISSISLFDQSTSLCKLHKFDPSISKVKVMSKFKALNHKIFDVSSYVPNNKIINNFLEEIDLKSLNSSFHLFHLQSPLNSGKGYFVRNFSTTIGYSYYAIHYSDIVGKSISAMEKRLDRIFPILSEGGDFICLHLEDFDNIFTNTEFTLSYNCQYDFRTIMIFEKFFDKLLGLANKHIVGFISTELNLPQEIFQFVSLKYSLKGLDQEDCQQLITSYLPEISQECLKDLIRLALNIPQMKLKQILRLMSFDPENNCHSPDSEIIAKFKSFIGKLLDDQMGSLNKVHWKDIGGLNETIDEVTTLVKTTLNGSHHKDYNVSSKSAVLLYGPPGTGKTLLAKVIANECSLNFVSVKGPELLNMYVGQTEANIREVFARVKNLSPCLLFCDELDSLAPPRGRHGDSGGVMDRVVAQLTLELDELDRGMNLPYVVVMGATNRPDLIDPALLRNGRFDKLIEVGGKLSNADLLSILQSQIYKLQLHSDVDLNEIVRQLEVRHQMITGAIIHGVVSEAVLCSIRRIINAMEQSHQPSNPDQNTPLIVTMQDFKDSIDLFFYK